MCENSLAAQLDDPNFQLNLVTLKTGFLFKFLISKSIYTVFYKKLGSAPRTKSFLI